MGAYSINYFVLYHFFTIAEYALITLLLRDGINVLFIRKLMMYSMLLFTTASLFIIFFVQEFAQFPTISNSIESLLVITWCILALWFIDANYETSVFQQPVFWFIISFLIYFAGTISFNGIYNHLLKDKTETARKLFSIINSVCIYLLYSLLIIGISRYKWKKSFLP